MTTSKWGDAPRRLGTISVGAPTVMFIMYLDGLYYDGLVFLVGLLAAYELQRMIAREQPPLLPLLIIGGSIVLAALRLLPWSLLLIAIGVLVGLLETRSFGQEKRAAYLKTNALGRLLGSVYVGLPLAALLIIRAKPDGLGWTYLLFVNNWTTDALALVGGRLVGQTKLAPEISAGKTVEGAFVGLIFGTIGGMIVAALFHLPLAAALVINVIISMLTIVGDLIESIFKRYYHIKDTGQFLPGHGGFLDRIDGLVLAIIPLYLMLVILPAL